MITPQSPEHAAEDGFDQQAVAFGHRRSLLVSCILGGLTIAGAGLGWMLGAAAVAQPMASGIIMAGVGLVLAGIGWLATAGVRFTRKVPEPITNRHTIARSTRNGVAGGWVAFILVLAGVLAVFLFAPRGREPDVLALLPMVMAIPTVMLLGFYRIRHIMLNRNKLYAGWLARRPG